MAEYFAPDQKNNGFGFAFEAAKKHPLIAKRIWNTYIDALAFANDVSKTGTAVSGLCLSILNDCVVEGKTYKAGIYHLRRVATTEGANDAELVPTGMSEADLLALIDSKIGGNVADIQSLSFEGNTLTVVYTHVNGEEEEITVDIPTADETKNGLMSKEHVAALKEKIKGVKFNNVTLPVVDGVAWTDFNFGLNDKGDKIVFGFGSDVVGEVDVADFVKDGILDSVELATADGSGTSGTFMKFTFNTASGKEPIYLNVEKLIDIYKLEKGTVTDGTYVKLTLSITGSGTSSDPWKVDLTIKDSELVQELTRINNTLDDHADLISGNSTAIEELAETVAGIVSVGGEANTIVKITLNGVELAPDANRVVNIPLATSSSDGAMSASDKAKLDGIEPMSEEEILDAIATAFE